MKRLKIALSVCNLILFFSKLSIAEGIMGSTPLSSSEIDKVRASMRTCHSNPTFLKDSMENGSVLPVDTSDSMQKEGKYSVILSNPGKQAYSTHLWQAIVSGAEKLTELNWVVIADDDGKVVTLKKWNDKYSKNKENCHHNHLMECDDQISKKISLAITSQATGVVKSGNVRVNCLHPRYVRLLQVLIDNKYTYNPATKKWENSKAPPVLDPEGIM